jgi:hypothetical protein
MPAGTDGPPLLRHPEANPGYGNRMSGIAETASMDPGGDRRRRDDQATYSGRAVPPTDDGAFGLHIQSGAPAATNTDSNCSQKTLRRSAALSGPEIAVRILLRAGVVMSSTGGQVFVGRIWSLVAVNTGRHLGGSRNVLVGRHRRANRQGGSESAPRPSVGTRNFGSGIHRDGRRAVALMTAARALVPRARDRALAASGDQRRPDQPGRR